MTSGPCCAVRRSIAISLSRWPLSPHSSIAPIVAGGPKTFADISHQPPVSLHRPLHAFTPIHLLQPMSAQLLGVFCLAFSTATFVYFTLWTFLPILPFTITFPPRSVLLSLPLIGIVGLGIIVASFVAIVSRK